MDHLFNKFSFYHLLDHFVPGFILSFVLYHVIPSAITKSFSGSTWLIVITFIVFSFILGMLNHILSFFTVLFYEKGVFTKIYHKIVSNLSDLYHMIMKNIEVKRRKKLLTQVETEFNLNIDDVTIEDVPFIENIEEKEVVEEVYEYEELFKHIQEEYIPDVLKNSDSQEINEYIYLYLQGKEIKSCLADFMTQKSLNRNLCSLCVCSSVLFLFMNLQCNFFFSLFYKLIMIIALLLIGNVFYKEYKVISEKVNKYILLWFVQQKEGKD